MVMVEVVQSVFNCVYSHFLDYRIKDIIPTITFYPFAFMIAGSWTSEFDEIQIKRYTLVLPKNFWQWCYLFRIIVSIILKDESDSNFATIFFLRFVQKSWRELIMAREIEIIWKKFILTCEIFHPMQIN